MPKGKNIPQSRRKSRKTSWFFRSAVTGMVLSGGVFGGSVAWNIHDDLRLDDSVHGCEKNGYPEAYARALIDARNSGALGPADEITEMKIKQADGTDKVVSFNKIENCVAQYERNHRKMARHPSRNIIFGGLGAGFGLGLIASNIAACADRVSQTKAVGR